MTSSRVLGDVQQRLLRVEQRLYPLQEKSEPEATGTATWNPTIVCYNVTGATTLSAGIGVDLRFSDARYIETEDYLTASDDGTTTIVTNTSGSTLWLRVGCTAYWQSSGSTTGQRGLFINASGTGSGPQVLRQYQQTTSAGLRSAHSVSGLIILPDTGYLWAGVAISNGTSAQTVSEASLDVTVEHVGDATDQTIIEGG